MRLTIVARYFRYFDWMTFFIMLFLTSIGLLFVFSATYQEAMPYSIFFKKQLFGALSGIGLYFLFSFIDYRRLCHWGYLAYGIVIGLLIFTLIKGSIGMGAQRWINLVLFKFQPSEITKLFLPAFVTYYLYSKHLDYTTITQPDLLLLTGLLGVSAILILKQPDLGTSLLITASGMLLLWIAGLNKKIVLSMVVIFCLCLPLGWKLLKPYQKKRIAVFLGEGEATKERYQREQAIIAIGSGGFYGKGLVRGTQNRFMFLPEGRTDFIYAVLCEEWGFLGAIFIIFLYFLLFLRLLSITASMHNFYQQLLAFGLWIHIVLSSIVNIAMVTGLLPIVGIPLPLMSYGVSNLWTTFACLGWINSIHIKQHHP